MAILVTGATGFVGQHLCRALLNSGQKVYAMARSEYKFKSLYLNCAHVQADLAKTDWIENIPKDVKTVIHTAGLVHSHNPKDFYEINHTGTKNLISGLKNHKDIKFILISSLAAGGPSQGDTARTEDDHDSPVSEYGKSKLAAENELKNHNESWKKIIIRPPMVIGPGDQAILEIFQILKKGIRPYIGKNGANKTYSFICVHDLVKCIMNSIEFNQNQTFYTAFPHTISYRELTDQIQKQMSVKKALQFTIPWAFVPAVAKFNSWFNKITPVKSRLSTDKVHEIKADYWTCNPQKSIDELKLNYSWDLEKTIEATHKDYVERGWL